MNTAWNGLAKPLTGRSALKAGNLATKMVAADLNVEASNWVGLATTAG